MTNTSRREFLGQVACAFAVAGVGCRIPKAAIAEPQPYAFTEGTVVHFKADHINTGAPAELGHLPYSLVPFRAVIFNEHWLVKIE